MSPSQDTRLQRGAHESHIPQLGFEPFDSRLDLDFIAEGSKQDQTVVVGENIGGQCSEDPSSFDLFFTLVDAKLICRCNITAKF